MMIKNPKMVSCTAALSPTRRQLGFASGKRARREGTFFVPMFCFQASEFADRPRLGLNPTPNGLLVGGSAIIVAIRFAASCKNSSWNFDPVHRSFDFSRTERVFSSTSVLRGRGSLNRLFVLKTRTR